MYMDRFLSGGGAYRQGGRWNSPGRAVVYMAESLSLCVLETLVHMVKLPMMQNFQHVWVDIPETLITALEKDKLPDDWKSVPARSNTKQIGDRWFESKSSPVLKVPSTVIPTEYIFVLNPSHHDFHKLKIGESRDFEFDKRLIPPAQTSDRL